MPEEGNVKSYMMIPLIMKEGNVGNNIKMDDIIACILRVEVPRYFHESLVLYIL